MPNGRLAREKSLVGATSSQDDGGAGILVEGSMVADWLLRGYNGGMMLSCENDMWQQKQNFLTRVQLAGDGFAD